MKTINWILMVFALFVITVAVPCLGREFSLSHSFQINGDSNDNVEFRNFVEAGKTEEEFTDEEEEDLEDEELDEIADPFEPVNRVFFHFNDKLYFWVLKPIAKGYSAVVPEGIRVSVRNFFNNITTPVRFVNNLLQFKIQSAGNELLRFSVNSTVGMLGLYDYARNEMGIQMQDEDFGQTLGIWGLGPGFYINWPFLGPSSLRDSVGYAGDYLFDPINYVTPLIDRYSIVISDRVNRTSLILGDYEEIKKDAIDPYTAFRDIYYQYRESKIER